MAPAAHHATLSAACRELRSVVVAGAEAVGASVLHP